MRTALDAIERGQLSIDHIENLPPGLSSLYEIFFRRLFPNPVKDFSRSRKVLETVAAAREPLTRGQIASATSLDSEDELPLILSRLASFVPASEGHYALFHKSLFEWLTGWEKLQDQPLAGAYHVNLQKGSAQLAGWCWAEYQRGPSQISPYCLRHLPAHLHQVGRDQLLPTFSRISISSKRNWKRLTPARLLQTTSIYPQKPIYDWHSWPSNSLPTFWLAITINWEAN